MNGQNTFLESPATPEQILGIFQDWQRLEWGKHLIEKEILSFDTTIKHWRDNCELQGWQALGKSLNTYFGTAFSKDEWQVVMKSEKQKTLRDVCSLIATRAILPKVGELKVFGKSCKTASAFFALRLCLQKAGVDVAQIRPSSRLDGFLRLDTQAMIETISRLAPGRLPIMKTKFNMGHRFSGWVCLTGLLSLIAGGMLKKPEWIIFGCSALVLGFIAITAFSNRPAAKVQLEGCETFADLSRLIAN
jgi:hypothetical protein